VPPAALGRGWHVGMAHGYFMPAHGRAYASFRLSPADLDRSGCDYVALGDWHAFRCVATQPVKAYYSGAPSSGTHTAAVVDLLADPKRVEVSKRTLRHAYPR
jgi:DNA repair exonuclease SbcCD nuclease subunit